jgi:hypothetical protein
METQMKYIATLLLTAALSSSAIAQRELSLKIVCDQPEKILQAIQSDYKEEPKLVLKDPSTGNTFLLTSNPTDQSWTIIGMDSRTGLACVIIAGQGISTVPNTKGKM